MEAGLRWGRAEVEPRWSRGGEGRGGVPDGAGRGGGGAQTMAHRAQDDLQIILGLQNHLAERKLHIAFPRAGQKHLAERMASLQSGSGLSSNSFISGTGLSRDNLKSYLCLGPPPALQAVHRSLAPRRRWSTLPASTQRGRRPAAGTLVIKGMVFCHTGLVDMIGCPKLLG